MTTDKVTVTAKVGPATTETSQVFNNVSKLTVDTAAQVVTLEYGNSQKSEFDLFGIATVTYTIASHVATVAFS